MSLRYTDIDYKYTGSNAFFGQEGAANLISSLPAQQKAAVVDEATDIRAYVRYKF
jgi:hypothetical protein